MIWILQRRHEGGRKWKAVEGFGCDYATSIFVGNEQDACAAAQKYVAGLKRKTDPDGEFRLKTRDSCRTIPIPRAEK